MNEEDKQGARSFALFWAFVFAFVYLYVHFAHPDTTQLRTFLNYWYLVVGYMTAIVVYILSK